MIGLFLAASNLPPWMTGPNVLYVGLYGYGAVDYEERIINAYSFKSTYTAKGLSSSSSHFGGGAFARWNTWGLTVDFQEGYFYKWKPSFADTTYTDTSFFQNIAVTLAHPRRVHRNDPQIRLRVRYTLPRHLQRNSEEQRELARTQLRCTLPVHGRIRKAVP